MELKLAVAPAELPVTLSEIKQHLRIDGDDTSQDIYLATLIDSAVEHIESMLCRRFVTQTWDAVCKSWEDVKTSLEVIPYGMTQAITSIKYRDELNEEQTVLSDYYTLSGAYTDSAGIVFDYIPTVDDFGWPELWAVDPVTVRFVCGYGEPEDVPGSIKSAIKLTVGDLFDCEDSSRAVQMLLNPYRLWRF